MNQPPFSVVVLISGNGSNLQAIIDYIQKQQLNIRIDAVISNTSNAYGLERARLANIPTHIINHLDYPIREQFDQKMRECIEQYHPELVVLAGFMRILSAGFVEHFYGRMINIHPSLLPKYRGLNTHRRVLEAGDIEHGISVHFVSVELDNGEVIAQSRIAVMPDDTEATLLERIHREEHKLYPRIVEKFATGEISLAGCKTG